ncbi:MAG: AzlD domain-containing protein [Proteobacteria bacterium]|nr:MAG: AzlD domain-containing protein [Pseudomonadota bacterium]
MNESYVYLLVIAGGIATYLIRISFLFLLGNRMASSALENVLRYIPAAVLAALTLPAILSPAGTIDLGADNLRLPAAVAAFAVGLKTRSILWVLASGMGTLWVLNFAFA